MLKAYLLFLIISFMLGLFIWGRWRYDFVAFAGLMLTIIAGIVPFTQAFHGFSNPAVITVACVMIISASITASGIVDKAVKRISKMTHNEILHILSLTALAAVLSAFMNNVGALALMMPIAIKSFIEEKRSPSKILMPLAFGSVLGGLTTAIGTPPNILISAYRQQLTGHAFAMFDFTPVGIAVAILGVIFISVIGWRLIPHKRRAPRAYEDLFHIQDYITEVVVPKGSNIAGMTRKEFEDLVEGNLFIIGLIRKRKKHFVIRPMDRIKVHDVLIVEASHKQLSKILNTNKLELPTETSKTSDILRTEDIAIVEAVIPQGSRMENRSMQSMRLRSRFGINILAIAREGKPFKKRLNHVNLKPGDVALLQGEADSLHEKVISLGFLPLAERGVEVGAVKTSYLPLIIFGIAILLTTLQILPVQISFSLAVLTLVLLNTLPIRKVYESIDWSIIVLLGAIIPLGTALQTTGGTELIASGISNIAGHTSPLVLLAILMILTMTLSDVMNNAATAVVMAPIAVSVATATHSHIDPFLMTVAVGSSCSFLTPISHQNNTLVMGPGGYKFLDYMRMGLPLELIVLVVSLPIILWVWPS